MYDGSASGMAYNRFFYLDGLEDRVIAYLLFYNNKTDYEKYLVTRIRRILLYDDVNALLSLSEGGYPDPDKRDVINITDDTRDDYYCGLALVPRNTGLTKYPGTQDKQTVKDKVTTDCIWVKAEDAIRNLIYRNCDSEEEMTKRVFRSPRMFDAFDVQCSLLKIYIDSINPDDHLKSVVNIGIDVVTHNKIVNLAVSENDNNTYIYNITTHSGDVYTLPVQTKSRVTVVTQAVLALLNGADVQGVGKLVFSKNMNIFNKAQYGLWNNRDFEGMKIVLGVLMSGVG